MLPALVPHAVNATAVSGIRNWPTWRRMCELLRRAVTFWTRVRGVLSLELAGHFAGIGFDPAVLFADKVDALLAR